MNTLQRLRHFFVAIRVGLRGLRFRGWSSLNAVLGTAIVVGMLAAVLGIGAGYQRTVKMAASDGNLLVMHAGARSEMESSLADDQVQAVLASPQLARLANGRVAASAEVYAVANVKARHRDQPMNVAVRGVGPAAVAVRPGFRIVAGRMFHTGQREIVVGRRALHEFAGLRLGKPFRFAGVNWRVVGVFADRGGLAESEIWTDMGMLQAAYHRGNTAQVVVVKPAAGVSASGLAHSLNQDSRQVLRVTSTADYYAEQANQMGTFARTLGLGVAVLMGLGAVFAVANTGYASVAARAKELATLAALGLEDRALMASVVVEVCVLTLLGGLLGAAAAWALFDGHSASTLFFSRDFTQVIFNFAVNGRVLLEATAFAMAIGVMGAVAPAWRSRRLPLARILAGRR